MSEFHLEPKPSGAIQKAADQAQHGGCEGFLGLGAHWGGEAGHTLSPLRRGSPFSFAHGRGIAVWRGIAHGERGHERGIEREAIFVAPRRVCAVLAHRVRASLRSDCHVGSGEADGERSGSFVGVRLDTFVHGRREDGGHVF